MDNNEFLIALKGIVKDAVQEEITPVKESIYQLQSDVTEIKGRLDVVEARLDDMDKRFDVIENRLDTIEENLEIVKTATNELIDWTEKAAVSIRIPFMETHNT